MRDPHRFDRRRDGPRVDDLYVLAGTRESDVRAERLSVERDVPPCELGPDPFPEREHGRRAGTDPEPGDARLSGRREAPGVIDLDVERGNSACRGFDRGRHVSQPVIGCLTEEGKGDVHQLRLHATQRGKIRGAVERRLGDLGGEW